MERKKMIQIAMIVCAAVLVIAAAATVSGFLGGEVFGYSDAGKYTAGEADISAKVNNLDVDWTAGKVILEYHGGSTVELRESSAKPISEDMKLRWWMDGDTLRVRYAKSGLRLDWNLNKELTIRLPEGITFRDAKISATSAGLMIPALKADTLTLSTTSGNIQAAAEAGQVKADATSGQVTLRLNEAEQVKIGSTSGNVTVWLAKFSSLKANTTSGRIAAALPESPGFTARISSVSGKIDYDMPLSHPEDRKGNAYICGDGSAEVELGTTSGNISLNRANQ